MPEQIMCCGKPVARAQSKTTGIVSIKCEVCGKYSTGQSAEEAINNFTGTPAGTNLPSTPTDLAPYAVKHMADMAALTMPFIARDKPALTRLIKNNVRYIVIHSRDGAMAETWKTQEGQESIIIALEEAMAIGAELGKTGSIVPFGSVVEFIPAVEAYEFALTNGSNPPFAWIQIDMIHKNDVRKISRINGEFSCSISPGMPRGELQGVAVYGFNNRLDHVIGEVYDADRLLKKAATHSSSYKYYLRDKYEMAAARTEGKVKADSAGREYIEKEMFKKGGGTWTKKLYYDEVSNPYDGADQPEMLRKAAGKSFLGKYARVRGAEAAAEEMKGTPEQELDKTIDATIDAAFSIIEQDGDPQPPPAPRRAPEPTPESEPQADDNIPDDLRDELNELSDEAEVNEKGELDIF
jgi:hypothetical protein